MSFFHGQMPSWGPSSSSLSQRLDLTQTFRHQYYDTSSQTTNGAGIQPHPSADRLPKDFLSCLQTWPCPTEGQDPAPPASRQGLALPSRKPAQPLDQSPQPQSRQVLNARKSQFQSLWTQPTYGRPDPTLGLVGPRTAPLAVQHNLQNTPNSISNYVKNCLSPPAI